MLDDYYSTLHARLDWNGKVADAHAGRCVETSAWEPDAMVRPLHVPRLILGERVDLRRGIRRGPQGYLPFGGIRSRGFRRLAVDRDFRDHAVIGRRTTYEKRARTYLFDVSDDGARHHLINGVEEFWEGDIFDKCHA